MSQVYEVIRYRISRCSELLHGCKETIRARAPETLNPRSTFWDKYFGLKRQASLLYACVHQLKFEQTKDLDALHNGFYSHSVVDGREIELTIRWIKRQINDGKKFKVLPPRELEVASK